MRGDKKKNISKVATVVLAKPLLTQREIAEEANVSLGTVNNVLTELEQTGTKDSDILYITDIDKEVVKLGVEEIKRRFKSKEEIEKMSMRDVVMATSESTKRYSVFKGDITGKDGGLKNTLATLKDLMS